MSNVFKTMATQTSGYFILVAWPLGLILLIVSGILMKEDYYTSLAGYAMLPTAKIDEWLVPLAVAVIPQAGQVVLFYIFGKDTQKRWAIALTLALFVADASTDILFKSMGQWGLVPIALAETVFIFTLGSEVLGSVMAGFLLQTWAEFFARAVDMAMMLFGGFAYAAGLGKDEPKQGGGQRFN